MCAIALGLVTGLSIPALRASADAPVVITSPANSAEPGALQFGSPLWAWLLPAVALLVIGFFLARRRKANLDMTTPPPPVDPKIKKIDTAAEP